MRIALLVLLVTCLAGVWSGWSAPAALLPYGALLVLVLVESAARAVRRWLEGAYNERDFGYYLGSMAVAVTALGWLGDWLSLGRIGAVPSLTLALEVALCVRTLGHVDAARTAWVDRNERLASKPELADSDPARKAGRIA